MHASACVLPRAWLLLYSSHARGQLQHVAVTFVSSVPSAGGVCTARRPLAAHACTVHLRGHSSTDYTNSTHPCMHMHMHMWQTIRSSNTLLYIQGCYIAHPIHAVHPVHILTLLPYSTSWLLHRRSRLVGLPAILEKIQNRTKLGMRKKEMLLVPRPCRTKAVQYIAVHCHHWKVGEQCSIDSNESGDSQLITHVSNVHSNAKGTKESKGTFAASSHQ